MILRVSKLIIIFTLFITSNSFADSDGTVGFGNDFIVYTHFGGNHGNASQSLNVISFKEDGSISDVISEPLPVSYSEIVISNNLIFVYWFKTLLVYEFKEDIGLNLTREFVIPNIKSKKILGSKYSILPHNNKVLIFTQSGIFSLNLDKKPTEWHLEKDEIVEKIELSDRRINKHGDWVPRYGTCLKKLEHMYCLAYSTSIWGEEGGYLKFNEKLLVIRNNYRPSGKLLLINSGYETIH